MDGADHAGIVIAAHGEDAGLLGGEVGEEVVRDVSFRGDVGGDEGEGGGNCEAAGWAEGVGLAD